ncbi:MAG: oxidoreductase [Coxiella sp. (in: Bacteria)]|nr:MAG: oxidoreductase [Coxiella sp. (in: g-proteobacteria)]
MNILVIGANGFVAREIIIALKQAGHHITACARRHSCLLTAIGIKDIIRADFLKDTTTECWLPRLNAIDVVINCVGVFQTNKKNMWKIHVDTPKALFQACEQVGIKKIVHLSALGIDKIDTPYATSKLAIEQFLATLSIDSTIIRPSFVYGEGAYGGSALFRGLAALPYIIPMPGRAQQLLQPVHIKDLARMACDAIHLSGKRLLCAVGPEKIPLKSLLPKLRGWLGFKKAIALPMPMWPLKLASLVGNLIYNAPLGGTGIKMMQLDNVASPEQEQTLQDTLSFKPRGFSAGLESMVSSIENRWHARLYFLKPLLRLSIAFIWLFTGIISLCAAHTQGFPLLQQAGIPSSWQPALLYGGAGVDLLLGTATFLNYRLRLMGTLQTLLIVVYTVIASFYLPLIWLHPLGPLAKNIPLLAAIWVMMALEDAR